MPEWWMGNETSTPYVGWEREFRGCSCEETRRGRRRKREGCGGMVKVKVEGGALVKRDEWIELSGKFVGDRIGCLGGGK
jgi:hypothetical protein